jgi:hypothetical protein
LIEWLRSRVVLYLEAGPMTAAKKWMSRIKVLRGIAASWLWQPLKI